MSLYTGETCLICNRTFNDEDDVVACPECGTPYHRSCYKEKKHCINDALHASHGSWMADNFTKKAVESNDTHICAKCGCPNPSDATSCRMCGTVLSDEKKSESDQSQVFSDPQEMNEYFGFDINETMDSDNTITLGEMADYVKSNRLFYMVMFRRLKNAAAKVSVNLIAFLLPEYFFASRKMYGWSALALIISFLLSIPAFMVQMQSAGQESFGKIFSEYFAAHPANENLAEMFAYVDLGFRLIAGMAANALYYRHIVVRLKKMRKKTPDMTVYRARVKTEGGVSLLSVVVLFLIQLLLAIIMMGVVLAKVFMG